MSENQTRSMGFWASLIRQFRLVWRLIWDPRVPGWTKMVPFVALLYIISPVDFLPDWFLGLGQLDDLGVLLVGVRLFAALSPEEIVLQHLEAMGYATKRWRVVDEEPAALDEDVIDAEYDVRDEQAN
jgi:uncharacterized membrane protein YkvA (DUF1232 family)